jgi:hypothetical protein
MTCPVDREFPEGIKTAGTLINHPDAYRLVQMGVAEPADAECAEASSMTPEKFKQAEYEYERRDRGIHPDDFEAYDAGYLVGYNPDGTWKPGANYETWLAEQETENDEDDEDDE